MSFAKPARTLAIAKLPNSTIVRLSIVFAAILVWFLICSSLIAQTLERNSDALRDGRTVRVKVILEAQGQLHPQAAPDADGKVAHSLPMKAIANLTYDEIGISSTDSNTRSARFYHQAQAQISVSNRPIEGRLREDLRHIFCDSSEQGSQLYSGVGALTRDELELLTVPGNSAVIDQLLTETPKEGQKWQHSDAVLARLLNLDAVTANDVTSSVAKFEDATVRIVIAGKIVGSVDGVLTEMTIEGKYNFDRKSNCITWLAMSLNEDREVGLTTPGFTVEARLRVVIEPTEDDSFVKQSIQTDVAGPTSRPMLLEFEPQDSSFTMFHGRRWHVISQSPKHAVLRMVDSGQTVAQCNLRELPVQEKAKTVTLDSFQQDVMKGLASANPQIVAAEETTNPTGLKVMRVQVSGSVANAPIQWMYHLAINNDGRSLSYVFTMAADQAEKFGASDIEITSALRFSDDNTEQPRFVELPKKSVIR